MNTNFTTISLTIFNFKKNDFFLSNKVLDSYKMSVCPVYPASRSTQPAPSSRDQTFTRRGIINRSALYYVVFTFLNRKKKEPLIDITQPMVFLAYQTTGKTSGLKAPAPTRAGSQRQEFVESGTTSSKLQHSRL